MRHTTRDKWYGRINASQALQLASAHLSEAIQMSDKPTPFTQKLDQVLNELKTARDHIVNHNMGHKRLIKRIDTERQRIAELLEDIKHIPLFPEEKATARIKRDKRNDMAAGKPVSKPAENMPDFMPVSRKPKAKRKRPVKNRRAPVRKKVKKNAPKSKN